MFATARRLPLALARPAAARRLFHASAPALVQVGDKLPNVDLMENSPGNKVNLATELKSGKGVIIGENNPALEADAVAATENPQLIICCEQAFQLPFHLHAPRTTSPDTSTRPSSRMQERSSLFLSTTASCRCLLALSPRYPAHAHPRHAETVSDEHPHAVLTLSHTCQCDHQPLLTPLHRSLSKASVGHVSVQTTHSFHMSWPLTQHSMKAWAKTLDPSGSSGVSNQLPSPTRTTT
jgi:hypothetical protein